MSELPPERPFSAVLAQRRDELRTTLSSVFPTGHGSFLWEVGSGHGHFLTAYAQSHPEKICIGVDIAGDRVERSRKKCARAQLSNLHFLRTDARLFLEALPPDARLSDVFILFPDPWPKLRHHKHRIVQPSFLDAIAAHADARCRLYFRTDHNDYFADAAETLLISTTWETVDEPWPFEFETVFQRRADQHRSLIARKRLVSP